MTKTTLATPGDRSMLVRFTAIVWNTIGSKCMFVSDPTCNRSGIQAGFAFRAQQHHPCRKPLPRQRSLPSLHEGTRDPQASSVANDEAIQKINVLETELAKLRAQIAQIVLAQERGAQSGTSHHRLLKSVKISKSLFFNHFVEGKYLLSGASDLSPSLLLP